MSFQQTGLLLRSAPYFPVADVEETAKHYEQVLGFHPEYLVGMPLQFAILSRDGLPVMLRLVSKPELISQNEAEKKMFRLAAQDESRHLAFGVTHLKYVMETEPWRREELHHYLDIQEGALGQSQQAGLTTNPLTGEALAILAGGGVEHMDEGFAKLMIMRKRQVNEYMHRLEVIGLGDRRERMVAGFRDLLDPVA